jgi:hypothetical protein
MKYEVIRDFVDVQNDNHLYRVGDPFPYNGADVSEERIDELASDKNRCGIALIKAIEVDEPVVEVEKKPKKEKKKEK